MYVGLIPTELGLLTKMKEQSLDNNRLSGSPFAVRLLPCRVVIVGMMAELCLSLPRSHSNTAWFAVQYEESAAAMQRTVRCGTQAVMRFGGVNDLTASVKLLCRSDSDGTRCPDQSGRAVATAQ